MIVSDFHFLRPYWLLALIPLGVFYYYLTQLSFEKNNWQKVVDAHLLPHLLVDTHQSEKLHQWPWPLILLALGWLLSVVALSGPTTTRLMQPLYANQAAHVILLDMSERMSGEDIAPNRYTRARFKVLDLLKQIREGQVGLIAYSGEPYVVSPLTQDANTIAALVPELEPGMMPVGGNDLVLALKSAKKLFDQANTSRGEIVVVTASPIPQEAIAQAKSFSSQGISISVLGMDPRYLSENIALAQAGKGKFQAFTATNEDVKLLALGGHSQNTFGANQLSQQMTALWKDQGRGWVFLLLPIAVVAFRRGWFERLLE